MCINVFVFPRKIRKKSHKKINVSTPSYLKPESMFLLFLGVQSISEAPKWAKLLYLQEIQ